MSTPAGKGRPTPKRADAQRRRTGPVAPPPSNRKQAAKQARVRASESRERVRDATARGDERYMGARDAGPVRSKVRDIVDSRRNVGVLLLPMALVLLLAQFSGNRRVLDAALTVWLLSIVAMLADITFTAVSIRTKIGAEFPDENKMRGHIGYGLLRSTVFRRFRLPPPKVRRGGAPVD